MKKLPPWAAFTERKQFEDYIDNCSDTSNIQLMKAESLDEEIKRTLETAGKRQSRIKNQTAREKLSLEESQEIKAKRKQAKRLRGRASGASKRSQKCGKALALFLNLKLFPAEPATQEVSK